MQATAIKSYDTKIDSKKRLTLRNTLFEYFHVEEFPDGKIILKPKVPVTPFEISAGTLSMMDKSIENFQKGNLSEPLDFFVKYSK